MARAVRSLGQGALVVDLTLYLHSLNWSGVKIGLALSGAGLFGALLSLVVGVASDRLRRRPFLLVYEIIILICSIIALLTAQPLILMAVIIVSGFGRGANGAAGPFSPAEQAWLAEEVAPEKRGRIYSLNSALGFFGMGIGALIAILPSLLPAATGTTQHFANIPPSSYRPIFAVVGFATLINLYLLFMADEKYRGNHRRTNSHPDETESRIRRDENKMLFKLLFLNSFNGVAVGLTGPLISYWFALRYHVGPSEIAPVMAVTFIITGISALMTGTLTERIGIVQSVVRARLLGLVLLIILPLMPLYWLASAVYLLRSAVNRGTIGARQALTIGLVRDERRGLATSTNAVSMQLPQSVGPTVAGYLLSVNQFTLPFYIAAFFQGIYVLAYAKVFKDYNLPRSEMNNSQV
ncbi:Arabinose efflux permease family protein [Candidatus Zixiibacteriota bacterium]|nr:Arabinose efflux permease family protein [candidate division Zixibacteria bacterium]